MNHMNNQGTASAGEPNRMPPSQPSQSPATISNVASRVGTLTITETESRNQNQNEEVLQLTLRARPSVTW
jgi:hypothetical protein